VSDLKCFSVVWPEDGTATVLGRLTWRSGSGSATGVAGEGNWLQIADVDTITYSAFDLDSSDPDNAFVDGTSVTVATAVLDSPVSTTVLWKKDTTGYNFIHDLPPATFPTGDRRVLVEYKITLTGGEVLWGKYVGTVDPNRTS